MRGRRGQITVEYEGRVTDELREYLGTEERVRLVNLRPLVIVTDRPAEVLNHIYRLLTGPEVGVRRIQLTGRHVARTAA